jgi:hypothetical protein
MVTSAAITEDRNVIKKEAEKVLKYKDLTIDIQRMCNVKTNVMPVITGATETISKNIPKIPEQRTGKARNLQLQKTAIFGTAHTLRKVLMRSYKTFKIGNNITCTINCDNTTATTMHALETQFQVRNCKYPATIHALETLFQVYRCKYPATIPALETTVSST